MKKEIWKPIKATKGIYSISSWGRYKRSKESMRKGFSKINKILSGGFDNGGYHITVLCCNGKKKTRTLHSLVAEEFIGKRKNGLQINHKNGNKRDNRVENLEYVTSSQNHIHSRQILKQIRIIKLCPKDVIKIRKRIRNGEMLTNIAKDYSVTIQCIHRIKTFKIWKNI